MVRTAIYVRVSTAEQAKEGYSIGEQTDRLKMFAGAHGWKVVKVYTDAGHSGATTDRPALQDMLSDIRAGLIDKVLVYKLDRLSRSQKDTLKLIEDEFLPHGTDFESMSESLDTSTPQGRLFLGILAAFAQLEREVIKERMSMGIEARVKEGKWRGGSNAPYGYTYNADQGKLIVDPYQSMIVKRIFSEYTEDGKSIGQIVKDLTADGHVFRSYPFNHNMVRLILLNRTYTGLQKCKDKWIQCNHEPIITEDQWQQARQMISANQQAWKDKGYRAGSESYSTNLAGLLCCARCGARYSKHTYGSRGHRYDRYMCQSRTKKRPNAVRDPNCKNKSWKLEELDALVIGEVKKLALDHEYLQTIQNDRKTSEEASNEAVIKDQLKSIKTQISGLTDLYSTGLVDLEDLEAKIRPLNDQRNKLQHTLETMQAQTAPKLTEDQTVDLLSTFEEVMDHGSLLDRRTILQQLIERIDIDGDDVTIHWNF